MPPRAKAAAGVQTANEALLSEPKRGRSRPRKADSTSADVATTEDVPLVNPTKRKRSHTTAATDIEEEAQPTKKTKGGTRKPATKAVKKKPSANKPAQSATKRILPGRGGRNEHPGAVTGAGPAPRRKTQDVEAERAAKKKATDDKIQQEAEAKSNLVQWQLAEEEEDHQMEAESFKRRHGTGLVRRQQEADESSGEEFELVDNAGLSDSSQDEHEEPVKKQLKGRKGGKKGAALREELNGMMGKMKRQKQGIPTGDVAPRKYQHGGMLTPAKGQRKVAVESRGLGDDDIDQARPNFPQSPIPPANVRINLNFPTALQRDKSRKNNLVTGNLKVTVPAESSSRVPSNSKSRSITPAVGKKIVETKACATNHPAAAKALLKVDQAESELDDTNIQDTWVKTTAWKKIFLPSLYHALYVSNKPFVDFQLESPKFLDVVQDVFNLAFPNVAYILQVNDTVVKLANRHLNEKKSKLAAVILNEVKGHVKTSLEVALMSDPVDMAKIRAFICWSVKPDGPAFFLNPTPIDCTVKAGEQGYIIPEGIFQSEIITSTAYQFLAYAENSHLQPKISPQNPPRGLYALILTAVERAFLAHLPSKDGKLYKEPAKFSNMDFGQQLGTFANRIEERVSERRWKEILGAVTVRSAEEQDRTGQDNDSGDLTVISVNRGDFYLPPSPVKT